MAEVSSTDVSVHSASSGSWESHPSACDEAAWATIRGTTAELSQNLTSAPAFLPTVSAFFDQGTDHVGSDFGPVPEPAPRKLSDTAPDDSASFEIVQPSGVIGPRGSSIAGRIDPRNHSVSIAHQHGLTATNQPQVVAKPILELGNLHNRHGPILAR
jgi:hypothetical protein